MSFGALYEDERLKMTMPQVCSYCGSNRSLSIDHLIPRIKGGQHDADNLVWACRSCNSSKSGRDMIAWTQAQGTFPPILLLRRYLKLAAIYCEEHGLMDLPLASESLGSLPFDLQQFPYTYPPFTELKLWISIPNPESPRSR